MQGSLATAVAFAVSGGEPADPRRRLFADVLPPTIHDQDRRLLVAVEPLVPSCRGLEVATAALDAARDAFEATSHDAVSLALGRAMAAADAVVTAENAASPAEERDHRIMIGATLVAIEGTRITIAQLPPSQAMLIQDGLAYGLPSMASWSPGFQPESDEASAEPLGTGNRIAPLLYRSTIHAGDLILLCDSALVRCLDDTERSAWDGSRTKLRTIDQALSWLEDVAACNDLDEVQAVCLAVPAPLPSGEPYAHLTSRRRRPRWLKVASRHRSHRPNAAGPFHGADAPSPQTDVPGPTASPPPIPATGREPVDEHDARASADSPLDVAETTDQGGGAVADVSPGATGEEAATEPQGAAANDEAPAPDSRGDLVAPKEVEAAVPAVMGSLEPMPWWRVAGRPRLHRIGSPRYLVVALVAVVALCGVAGLWHGRSTARAEHEERMSASFAIVDAVLAGAAAGGASQEQLDDAAVALDRAEEMNAPGAEIAARRASLASYQDAVAGVVRLGGLTRIGGLPPELAGDGSHPARLIRANRDLYLVAGGFYRLDLDANNLVPVLAPGSEIGEQVVGSLVTGAWAPGGLSVTDGAAVYTVDAGDTWSVRSLGSEDPATWNDAPAAALNGAFYLLDPANGRIHKYDAADSSGGGDEWLPASEAAPLRNARDMVIDGEIHVLLADGRIATLANGGLAGIRPVAVEPPLSDPLAFSGGMDTMGLWILDQVDGEPRLIRVEPAGGAPKAFRLALTTGTEAAAALASVHDVAVDEAGHIVYFLTDDAIWRADLPVFVPVE